MNSSSDRDSWYDSGEWVEIDGIPTFTLERGSGPALVLLHGAAIGIDSRLTWFRAVEDLAPHFRVIVFDQVGFGHSGLPPDGRYWDRLRRSDHAGSFLKRRGIEKAILVGHSEGAFVATRLAITAPELVSRLVIVTSGGTAPRLGGAADEGWIRAARGSYDYAAQAESEQAFIESLGAAFLHVDPELEAVARESFRLARESGSLALLLALAEQRGDPRDYPALQERWILPHLGDLRVPALLIWAAQDATVPIERGLRLRALIPRADFHLFDRARHMVMHDRRQDFARLIIQWCGAGGPGL